jgi:transposase
MDKIDLTAFDVHRKNQTMGAPSYDPKILLKIVLFAYSKGILGSRRIEKLCKENIQCMALSGQSAPDHSTIAAFVSRSPEAIKYVFLEVLMLCDEAGLIGKEHFAIDGVKMPSNASKALSGTFEELKHKADKLEKAVERMLRAHQEEDLFKGNKELAARTEKNIETLGARSKKIRAFLNSHEPKLGPKGKERKTNVTDPDSAKMATSKGVTQGYTGVAVSDNKRQVIVEAQAHGAPQEQELFQPVIDGVVENFQTLGQGDILVNIELSADAGFTNADNVTYLDSHQCDGYLVDNQFRKRDPRFADADQHKPRQQKTKNRRFTPADFDYDPDQLTCACPAGNHLYRKGINARFREQTGTAFMARKSDCEDCPLREKCLKQVDQKTPRQVVFFNKDESDQNPNPFQKMKDKVDTPRGRAIYAKRIGTIEPVFGNIRHNKGMNRFTLRGKEKVDGQFKLFCLVHNIEKIAHYGQAVLN